MKINSLRSIIIIALFGLTSCFPSKKSAKTDKENNPQKKESSQSKITLPAQDSFYVVTLELSKKEGNNTFVSSFLTPNGESRKLITQLAKPSHWSCIREKRKRAVKEGKILLRARHIDNKEKKVQVITIWSNQEAFKEFSSSCETEDFFKALKSSDFNSKTITENYDRKKTIDFMKKLSSDKDSAVDFAAKY